MESRHDNKKNFLTTLPHEVLLTIFQNNNTRDLTLLQFVSHFFNNLIKDNLFWNARHKEYFLDTPFEGDNKNQYIAAEKHSAIFSVTEEDKQQIAALECKKFIKAQHATWTNYYRGLLLFNGFGMRSHPQQGFLHLLDALDNGDYRAALKIAHIVTANKVGNPPLYTELMLLLDPKRQKTILTMLTNAHDKRIISIAKLLGRMHALGTCTSKNITKAEEYYLEAIKIDPINNIIALSRLKFDNLPSPLSDEQKAIETIEYLQKFKSQVDTYHLQLALNYWRGYLAYLQGDNLGAHRFLAMAAEIPKASILLAHVLTNDNLTELAILYLTNASDKKTAQMAGEIFDIKIENCSLEETIQQVIQLTHCRKIGFADHVSAYLRNSHSIDLLAEDSYHVWWLLLAAQAGCVNSLSALQLLDPKETPYICLALAIVYEFGIFGSKTIEPSHDKAEYYFSLIKDPEKIKEYIQTAKDHDFSCEEIHTFLGSKLGSTPRNKK